MASPCADGKTIEKELIAEDHHLFKAQKHLHAKDLLALNLRHGSHTFQRRNSELSTAAGSEHTCVLCARLRLVVHARMVRQDRELATTDVDYVKWTQWIFLQLFNRGLAEQSEAKVNWCAGLGTVLANEEVINGKSERGDFPVTRMPLRQWVLKITE